jgi:AcrR family transcriptional regulator
MAFGPATRDIGSVCAMAATHGDARRGPGRPRVDIHDESIVAEALAVLRESGYEALTIEGVARRAGVSRPTVYRRWSSKAALALAAVAGQVGPLPRPDTGSLGDDLRIIQRHQARLIGSPLFREVVPALVTHFSTDDATAEAYLRDFIAPRRHAVATALDRAVQRGEIVTPPDVQLVYDAMTGPLFYRSVARRERLSAAFADAVTDMAITLVKQTDKAVGLADVRPQRP